MMKTANALELKDVSKNIRALPWSISALRCRRGIFLAWSVRMGPERARPSS